MFIHVHIPRLHLQVQSGRVHSRGSWLFRDSYYIYGDYYVAITGSYIVCADWLFLGVGGNYLQVSTTLSLKKKVE